MKKKKDEKITEKLASTEAVITVTKTIELS